MSLVLRKGHYGLRKLSKMNYNSRNINKLLKRLRNLLTINKASNLFSSVTSVDFQVKDIKKNTIDNQFIHETEY